MGLSSSARGRTVRFGARNWYLNRSTRPLHVRDYPKGRFFRREHGYTVVIGGSLLGPVRVAAPLLICCLKKRISAFSVSRPIRAAPPHDIFFVLRQRKVVVVRLFGEVQNHFSRESHAIQN